MNAIAISDLARNEITEPLSSDCDDLAPGIRQLADHELWLIGGGDVVGNYD